MPLASTLIQLLLADSPDVRHIPKHLRRRLSAGRVVPLVQAQVLLVTVRIGRLDHHGFQRVLKQHRIVDVGGRNHRGDRIALLLGQHAALAAILGPIRGIWADLIPPKRALPIDVSLDCQVKSTPPISSHFCASIAQIF